MIAAKDVLRYCRSLKAVFAVNAVYRLWNARAKEKQGNTMDFVLPFITATRLWKP